MLACQFRSALSRDRDFVKSDDGREQRRRVLRLKSRERWEVKWVGEVKRKLAASNVCCNCSGECRSFTMKSHFLRKHSFCSCFTLFSTLFPNYWSFRTIAKRVSPSTVTIARTEVIPREPHQYRCRSRHCFGGKKARLQFIIVAACPRAFDLSKHETQKQ